MEPCKIKYFPLKINIISFRTIYIVSKSKQCTKAVSRKVKAHEATNTQR